MDASSYTYLRLKTRDGEAWAAVAGAQVGKGTQVTIENAILFKNFKSNAMDRTFPLIYLGSLAGSAAGSPRPGSRPAGPHSSAAATPDAPDVRVPKATGVNALTVADIMTKSAGLKDKQVLVRGKIVKYNPGIMGKNWVHLRDGSGSAADRTNDILVTTAHLATLGDVVTVKGFVRTDKNFGAGYSYKVLIEDATLLK